MTSWAVFGGGAVLLLAAGGMLTEVGPWYAALRKPVGQPPAWLFAPAWTVIMALAAWAGVLSWAAATGGERVVVGIAFALNAALHLLWSPLFFKWKRPDWALIEIPFLWLSVASLMIVAGRLVAWTPWLLVPYLVWVSYAIYLNRGIVRLNGPFPREA